MSCRLSKQSSKTAPEQQGDRSIYAETPSVNPIKITPFVAVYMEENSSRLDRGRY